MSNNKIDYSKFDLEHYVEEFAEKDHSKSKNNEAWFRCCFHEENTASLKVANKQAFYCHGCGENGGVLDFVKKANGINTREALNIISELSGQEVVYEEVEEVKELFYQPNNYEAVYSYNDGNVLKYRLPNKMFTWGHYDNDDSTWYKGSGKDFITLYKPKGLNNRIIIAEGEKDVDTLVSLGFHAISSPHGVGKWRKEYTQELKDIDKVIIISDNDATGKMGAEAVQYALMKESIDVKIINSTDLIDSDIEGFDVTDAYEIMGDELKGAIQNHLDSEELWNVRWNDDTGEIIDVEVTESEVVETEVMFQSGLGEEYDLFIAKAVDDFLENGRLSDLLEVELKDVSKNTTVPIKSIRTTIQEQYEKVRKTFVKDEVESKKMEISEIGATLDITGSGYAVVDKAGKIIDQYEQEVIGHFLGFAGIVIDAEAEQDDNVKIALAYNTPQNLNKMNLIVVPKKSISSGNEIVKELSGYNINVTSANANDVVKYLQDSQNFFQEDTRVMKTLNRFGWYDGKLMPYEQDQTDIIFDPTHVQPIANKLTDKVGSREKSLELIQEIAVYSEANATILGAAVGSLVLSYMNDGGNQSFALNVWNETSTGKSVTCQGVASLFGYPFKDGGWWGDGNATANADINHNSLLGNLPNFIDDPARNRGLNSEEKRNYVFSVTSGEGRGRMMRDGITKQKTREWCNVMIMTNETPFIDDDIADGGARARCLEVCFDKRLDTPTVERWISLMRDNHGHFGQEIAEKIRSLGKRYFEEQLKIYVRWFNNRGVDGKRAVNASIIQMGIDVVKQTLGINVIPNEEWLVKEIRGSGSLSDGERAYYKLMEIVEVNINTYRGMFTRDGVLVGSLGYDRPYNTGRKVINLPPATLNKYAKENNFSMASLIAWGYANNKMNADYDENGKPKPIRVFNQNMKVDVIQVYYNWDSKQVVDINDNGISDASALQTLDEIKETEVIDVG